MNAGCNRLIHEKSPYLLQHARNPVDWRPWGEDAFLAAREQDKPLFVSIGYSTCHWCHVMERECFEDEEAAALINAVAIPVKIDREERPDLDGVYMAACQLMTGAGGWPLSLFLDHELRPFFAATYIPKHTRFGRKGLMDLLPAIAQVWRARRGEVSQAAGSVLEALGARQEAKASGADPGQEVLEAAQAQLAARYDHEFGGFGDAPKFPSPHQLLFLLRRHRRTGDPEPLAMASATLRAMRLGGIFDHVGLGFHRYSTDKHWLAPHFEKMLYDQAMLLMAYAEAWQAGGDPLFERAAREIAAYVARDLTGPGGAFLCAEDADSEGEEGRYYVWSRDETVEALGREDADWYAGIMGFQDEGNFRDEATGEFTGRNIPHLARVPEPDELARLEALRGRLFAARLRRVPPHKDDKVLTDWNGLMIAALAQAARALDDPAMAQAAGRAAGFVLSNLRDASGGLLHRWREGEAAVPGTLDDHAFLAWGLTELYLATFELRWLEAAQDIARRLIDRFLDASDGGFYFSALEAGTPLMRQKPYYDAAIPSGNSAALIVLERLSRLCARPDLARRAADLARSAAATLAEFPSGFAMFLCGLDQLLTPGADVVIAAPDVASARPMLRLLWRAHLPDALAVLSVEGGEARLAELAPHTAGKSPLGGKATAHVCGHGRCAAPTTDAQRLLALARGSS